MQKSSKRFGSFRRAFCAKCHFDKIAGAWYNGNSGRADLCFFYFCVMRPQKPTFPLIIDFAFDTMAAKSSTTESPLCSVSYISSLTTIPPHFGHLWIYTLSSPFLPLGFFKNPSTVSAFFYVVCSNRQRFGFQFAHLLNPCGLPGNLGFL